MDKWKEVIEYIDLLKQYTKADPQKVLNVLKNNWKAVGAPAAKDDDYTLVRKAWTLYVCLGIYNGFGTPFKERKNIKISNRILNFVMSPGYKTNYPVFSVKARAWKDRSEPQHAKNCRKLWDSPKGKEIRKHLKRLKGKLPIMYKQELNPLFKK